MVNFAAYRFKIVEAQINDGVANIGHLVQLFEFADDEIANKAALDFGATKLLQLGLHLAHNTLNVGGGNGAFVAGHAQPGQQLLTRKLLTGVVSLDEEGGGQNRPFVGAKTLIAGVTDATAARATAQVVTGVYDAGLFMTTVGTFHSMLFLSLSICPASTTELFGSEWFVLDVGLGYC